LTFADVSVTIRRSIRHEGAVRAGDTRAGDNRAGDRQ
jgi:hypothetical protein